MDEAVWTFRFFLVFSDGRHLWKSAALSTMILPLEKNIQAFHRIGPAPVSEGKASLDELRRAIKDLGLHGVTITSQVNGLSLDSPKLYPLYETVMELDVPIFVHPPWSPLATNS